MLHYHAFPAGTTGTLPPKLVTREEVIAFALEFDPQPMHLDETVAAASLLGGIAASGWHSCAMLMRMICDGFLLDTASMGSPGLKEVRWLKPVMPGDVLDATWTVRDARLSVSRPGCGIVSIVYEVTRQADGESVMTWEYVHFMGVSGEA
jgi:acyl dehydratase